MFSLFIHFFAIIINVIICQEVACNVSKLLIATGAKDNTVKILDILNGGRCEVSLTGHTNSVYTLALSMDRTRLFSGSGDLYIKVWDVKTGTLTNSLCCHKSPIFTIDSSPDDQFLASASAGGEVRIWKLIDGAFVKNFFTDLVNLAVKFSPDSRFLAIGGTYDNTGIYNYGAVRIRDLTTDLFVKDILSTSYNSIINTLAFLKTSDKSYLLAGSQNGSLLVYNVETNFTLEKNLQVHQGTITFLAVSDDGALFASVSADFMAFVWYSSNFTLKTSLRGHNIALTSVDFSPDGKYLVTGYYDGTVNVWDLASRTCIRNGTFHTGAIWMIKFFACADCQNLQNPTCRDCYLDTAQSSNYELGVLNESSYLKCKDYNCRNCSLNNKNVQCSSCLQGLTLDAGVCLCGKDCLSCNSNKWCIKCRTNYYLELYSQDCTTCQGTGEYVDAYYSLQDGGGVCLKESICQIPHCYKCANLYKICVECQTDFYLTYDPVTTSFKCTDCKMAGYFSTGIYCEACEVGSNCNECTGRNICRKCAPGYFLKQGLDGTVVCNKCTNSNEYLDIKNNNYDGTGVCLSSDVCSSNQASCKTCANKYLECAECQAGFYLTLIEDNYKCTACLDQEYFKDGLFCRKCTPGQFIKYIDNSTAKCTACEEAGYFKNGYLCSECLSKCDQCLSQNACLACQKNYYLLSLGDATNQCVKCDDDHYYIDGNACKQCRSDCRTCENGNKCASCFAGSYLLEDSRGNITCSKCEEKGYFKKDGKCLKCKSSCFSCADENSCLSCPNNTFLISLAGTTDCIACNETGLFVNGSNCLKCRPDCATCSDEKECSSCPANFYLLDSGEGITTCDKCDKDGYYKADGKCLKCKPNCKKCVDGNSCADCLENFYLIETQIGVYGCSLCNEPGFFVNDRTCRNCPSNCEKCRDSTSCQKCLQNFYLKRNSNQAGQAESFFCSACDKNSVEYPDPKNNNNNGSGSCINRESESPSPTGTIAGATSGAAVLLLLIIYGVRRKRTKPNKSKKETNSLPVDIEQINTQLNTRPSRPSAPFVGNRSEIDIDAPTAGNRGGRFERSSTQDVQTRKPRLKLKAPPKLENDETQNFEEIFKQFSSITFPNPTRLDEALKNKKLIGSGTFGTVYKFKMDGAAYAIKTIQTADVESIVAAVNEINIFTKASCKQVIQMYWISTKKNSNNFFDIYIIMDYLKYSLQKVLEEKIPLKKADKISIVTNLAGGLERFENFSEQDSLIHCDIKPANVLVSFSKEKRLERKRVFFADFGVGAICRKGTSVEINGYTKKYSSPEILTDNRASTKSDVYALGILALDILGINNQNLSDWQVKSDPILFENWWDTMIKNFKSKPKEKVFNDELLKLIKCMLSHDPSQRPKASEILEKLDALKKTCK